MKETAVLWKTGLQRVSGQDIINQTIPDPDLPKPGTEPLPKPEPLPPDTVPEPLPSPPPEPEPPIEPVPDPNAREFQ